MKEVVIIFYFVIMLLNNIFSQVNDIEWQSCYGGSNDERASDLISSNNGYLIIGYTESNNGDITNNHGGTDVWLLKIDVNGNFLWQKSYGGSLGDDAVRIFKAENENYYILGSTSSIDGDISNNPYGENPHFWILKIDSIGTIIWDRTVGGPGLQQLWSGTRTFDDGIVGLGRISGGDGGDISNFYGLFDMWMIKIDSNGNKCWDFSIGSSGLDVGQALIQTSDSGFLVGGASVIDTGGNITCAPNLETEVGVLMKLDSSRNIQWQHCYGGSGHVGVTGLLELDDGYIFTAFADCADGELLNSGWHAGYDIWVVKIDFAGNIIWQKCYGGSNNEWAKTILHSNDGGFVIVGESASNDGDVIGNHTLSQYYNDIWMFKINSAGDLIWQRCFGGIADELNEFGTVKISESKYIIAGAASYSPSYDVNCNFHYTGIGNYDYWIFQASDTTLSIPESMNESDLITVYPNPASTYIIFKKKQVKPIHIQIFNLVGQLMESVNLVDAITVISTDNFKNGIYFFKPDNEIINGKIIITK